MLPFQVKGMPPNKSGDGSMWGKKEQTTRLIALREEALKHRGSQMLTGRIRLTLEVHVGIPDWDTRDADARRTALKERGDLDNSIAGVCDGLMAAHENLLKERSWHKDFDAADPAIHPKESIAYKDDAQIMEIRAKKVVVDGALGDWYEVELEDLGPLR